MTHTHRMKTAANNCTMKLFCKADMLCIKVNAFK